MEASILSIGLMGRHALWFLISLNIILAITSTLGNILILAALHEESSLHAPSKILLRSLALTDLCAGIISEPIAITLYIATEYENWDLCLLTMSLLAYIGAILCLLSLFTLTAISVDRLLALLLGMRYRQVVTSQRVTVVVVCSWIVISGCFIAVILTNFSEAVFLYCFSANVILFLVVSTCCYIKIYQKLLQHQAQVHENIHQGQPNGHEPLNIARYRKTVSSTLWIQFSLIACYLPLGITVGATGVKGEATSILLVAWPISSTLMFFNSTLNPILYCWRIREVRRAAIYIVGRIWCG